MKTSEQKEMAGSKAWLFALCLGLLALVGCGRGMAVKTVLNADEGVQRSDVVYVDGAAAGEVRAVRLESGLRLAELAITQPAARSKMKVGVVRIPKSGRVELVTSGVQPEATRLAAGALIPTQGGLSFAARQYALNQTTLIAAAAFLIALLLGLGLKKIFKSALVLVVAVPLSGLAAWVVAPNFTPLVEKFYARTVVENAADSSASASGTPVPAMLRHEKALEEKLIDALEHRPDPRAVAFCGVFLVALAGFALATGVMIRVCSA